MSTRKQQQQIDWRRSSRYLNLQAKDYKVTVLRTDFKSRAVCSFSYSNYDLDEVKSQSRT
ncbi:MAG TPA: hypothetical protein VIW25_13315 [Nitrososphaeraceae archaeon]